MPAIPELHKKFLEASVKSLQQDQRILGVAAGGSYLLNEMDEFSDLDLVIYINPDHYPAVLNDRQNIAKKMGSLLESFTGEHVGEPRLLICLYGPPLLHIDLKFVSMNDIKEKVENPIVLWERDKQISSVISTTPAEFPQPDPEWIEARFWTWVHYTATKIGRGELFEAVESIGFIKARVLGPMLLVKNNARPQGLRKIERYVSDDDLVKLKATIPTYDAQDCLRALLKSVELYESLRQKPGNAEAKTHVMKYLDHMQTRID